MKSLIFFSIQKNKKVVIFTGDYINKGFRNLDVLLTLFLLKTHYPNSIVLLKGEEESFCKYARGTFKNECLKKYNRKVYNLILEVIYALPTCAIINNQIFVSHKGTPSTKNHLSAINNINRFHKVPLNELSSEIIKSCSLNGNEFMENLNLTTHVRSKNNFELSVSNKLSYKIDALPNVYEKDSYIMFYTGNDKKEQIFITFRQDPYIHEEYSNAFDILGKYAKAKIGIFIDQCLYIRRIVDIDQEFILKSKVSNQMYSKKLVNNETKESVLTIDKVLGKDNISQTNSDNDNIMLLGDYKPLFSQKAIKMKEDENASLLNEKIKSKIKKRGLKQLSDEQKKNLFCS